MVRTHKYVLAQLVAAFVAHLVNGPHHLLLTLIKMVNAARKPFRLDPVLIALTERRRDAVFGPDDVDTVPALPKTEENTPVPMPAAFQPTGPTVKTNRQRKPKLDTAREAKLANAIQMVAEGVSRKAAARTCGVAESSLRARLNKPL